MMNTPFTRSALALMVSTLVFTGMANAAVLIDFGTAEPDPTGNWNKGVQGNTTSLIDDTGSVTTIDLTFTGDLRTSTSTGVWDGRTVDPAWADADALDDRLWLSEGESGSLTISGLDSNTSYDIELASAFNADAGSSGNAPSFLNLIDANGVDGDGKGVTGVNVDSGSELTFNASEGGYAWTVRTGQGDWEEGWLGWFGAVPDVNGELVLSYAAPSGAGDPRVALNAMKIEVVPEPASLALLGLGTLMVCRRRRG